MLKRGSRGDEVEALQRALPAKGINPGPVDGVFGPKTEAAVPRFQERSGLTADGIAGPKTTSALQAKTPSAAPAAATRRRSRRAVPPLRRVSRGARR